MEFKITMYEEEITKLANAICEKLKEYENK